MNKEDEAIVETIGVILVVIPVLAIIVYGIVRAFMLQFGFGVVVVLFGMFVVGCVLLYEE